MIEPVFKEESVSASNFSLGSQPSCIPTSLNNLASSIYAVVQARSHVISPDSKSDKHRALSLEEQNSEEAMSTAIDTTTDTSETTQEPEDNGTETEKKTENSPVDVDELVSCTTLTFGHFPRVQPQR